MYEVILYAAIATIICAVLYSVLGKSVGQGPESGIEGLTFGPDKSDDEPMILEPVNTHSDIPGVNDLIAADKTFSPQYFLDGAKGAYSMILEAFAEGDRELLGSMLNDEVYAVYDQAISDREDNDLTQITDLARIMSAESVSASVDKKMARVSVEYTSELSSSLVDADGQAVSGDPDVLSTVTEVWTFERALNAKTPDWSLADVEASTGDELEADPTPDTKS